MNILVVDDNAQNAYQLQFLLESKGNKVTTVVNGAEALAAARQNPPELVISDILMPVMDGFTLRREWKKDERLKSIPFIFYTSSYTYEKDREFAMSIGAEEFLVKPEEPDVFMCKIEKVFHNAHQHPTVPPRVEPEPSKEEESEYLQKYNETLVRQLETKMKQLEQVNQNLEQTLAERKRAAEKIEKLYIFQTIIREINQNLLRIKNEPELFQMVCDLLKKLKYIRFVWIGLKEEGGSRMELVSRAGMDKGYLDSVQAYYGNMISGSDPIRKILRCNRMILINDLETSSLFPQARKEEALKRKYASNAVLPIVHKEEMIGILSLYSDEKNVFGDEEATFLEEVANDIAVGIKSLRLGKKLEEAYMETKETLEGTIGVISLIGELRDPYTAGHQQRVSRLACAISEETGIKKEQIEGVRIAGLLHDIGKIAVPSDILNKPGKLTNSEFEIIKSHPDNGYKILKKIKFLWPVAEIALQHHERIDGTGYPAGMSGNEILTEAKILGVADVVEAMGSHRPYRPSLGMEKALEEIRKNRGILYDATAVDSCLKVFEKGFTFE